MLSNTAIFGDSALSLVDISGWALILGGDDIGSRVDIFEEIFLVFMGLGTLVGIVVISYMLTKAYRYRAGNEESDDPVGRPQLGELPTGAEKGGRKLFLSFGISAFIVVSLVAWTYGMLLVVEGEEAADADLEVEVDGFQFGWEYTYVDEDRVPVDTVEEIAVAVHSDQMDVDSGDIDEAVSSGEFGPLLETVRAEASDSDDVRASNIVRDADRLSSGMTDDGDFGRQSFLVPAEQQVWITVTASDVWHNFGITEFRVKTDAIPGETTETWFETGEPTTENPEFDAQGNVANQDDYYVAECFELCGGQHSNMKSQVDVVPEEDFEAWYHSETVGIDELADAIEDEVAELRAEEEEEENDDETSERISAPATGVIGA